MIGDVDRRPPIRRPARAGGACGARRALAAGAAIGLTALAACGAGVYQPIVTAAPPAGVRDARLILVGDAGSLEAAPVLAHVQTDARASVADDRPTLVVFLGDNAYPDGVPARPPAARDAAEQILQLLIDRSAPAPAVFVPGNHDWNETRRDGLTRLRAQQEVIARHPAGREGRVALVPAAGCPGPVSIDVGRLLRVVAIDTEWLLRDGEASSWPGAPDICEAGPVGAPRPLTALTPAAVVAALGEEIEAAGGRRVVVVGHHPLRTRGRHARFGSGTQDTSSTRYRRLVAMLDRQLRATPPLAVASGHDHSLQVLRGSGDPFWQLVSGATQETTAVYPDERDTTFAASRRGYMLIDFYASGAAHLQVKITDARSGGTVDPAVFGLRLSP
jgi:hypothetical protein